MKSIKKRRTISIDTGIVDEIKSHSNLFKISEGKPPTTVAVMILTGTCPPVRSNAIVSGKTKSVSMPESLYLSIKARAELLGLTISKTAHLILLGKETSLSKSEIDFGLDSASIFEMSRSKAADTETVNYNSIKSSQKIPESENHINDSIMDEKAIRDRQNLSKGVILIDKNDPISDIVESGKDYYGGVFSL